MVNITLEEVALGPTSKGAKRSQRSMGELQRRMQQLEDENKQLNLSLEELDNQHNQAMQNVLELKTGLQDKLAAVTKSYESLKKEHAEKFINTELDMGKLKKQLDQLEADRKVSEIERGETQKKIGEYEAELKKAAEEMADLQTLLEKKSQDNIELIEKVKTANRSADDALEEHAKLLVKIELLTKELDEAKKSKEKKTSESSTSSTGKQSEDEFIVVREGDANSSGPATPPTKEELKDKIVQLENQVSELTLENGSLALKLQNREMEAELASTVLRENLQSLQRRCEETESELASAKEQMEEQHEKLEELKERAAEAIIAQEQVKALAEEKVNIEKEITKLRESFKSNFELEKRLILSEQEKESLQVELQGLRAAQERVQELESKVQKLMVDNQNLRLNAEAETETLNNSAELETKLRGMVEENESLRAELESMAQDKFRLAIAQEKKEVTDLDADDDEAFDPQKLRALLEGYVKQQPGDSGKASTEKAEKAYKQIYERLSKVSALEKSLAQMSEELLDLQDSKLVWDHEKKTLDADISQYILQCDELMKNNEILLNELENYKRNKLETIHEHNEESILHLESQLEECSKLNVTLEQEYAELNKKIDDLEREKQKLTETLRAAQEAHERGATKEKDYKLQVETLELEKCNLLFELNELKSGEVAKSGSDDVLRESEAKCVSLENQLARLSKDHADLVAALQSQKAALIEANKRREEAEKVLDEQARVTARMSAEIKQLQEQRQQQEGRQAETEKRSQELMEQNKKLQQEMMAKDIVAESLKSELSELQARLLKTNESLKVIESLERELVENRESLKHWQDELQEKVANEERLQNEIRKLRKAQEEAHTCTVAQEELASVKATLAKEYQTLKEAYEVQTIELQSLKDLNTTGRPAVDANAVARIAQLETELLATADLQKTVDSLTYEKNEMIKALQQKHSENMQYYMEIQRLQPIVQQLQQQLATVSASASASPSTTEPQKCDKCPSLESTIVEMRQELEKQQDQVKFLKEKSDILTMNLLSEQTNQKVVQQEKAEIEEQNAGIRKDLDRLREHLLEIEDLHTQETVEMQRELEETKAQMLALQEEVSKSSNAYTSASIRANQHAETLQAQYALVVQQRDELVGKLSLAEDRESKNQAALCNLQCALEQFQNDKEHDIQAATQRIRRELQQEMQKEVQLQTEIENLNQQLAEANQGLRAASRLSDQLESSQQAIAVLREEVDTLKQENTALREKLNTSESSQTDKIDKNLIKSLLIGYVVSGNPNDKNQILRMISSVLEFTQGESDKVGLNKQHSSWLGSILGGGGGGSPSGSHSKDNLVQAFVQFLEQESQPKVDPNSMPNLLNMTQSPSSPSSPTDTTSTPDRRISVSSNSGSAPIPIQPLMLNSNVLNEFAPTRNSSSILKDILSDS